MTITYVLDERTHRLRARVVDGDWEAKYTAKLAGQSNGPKIRIIHGGSVANAYNYPAETESLVIVAFPSGRVACWATQLPANKVTDSGILARCLGDWARPIDDGRYREDNPKRLAARARLVHLAACELGEPHDEARCVLHALAAS